MARHVSVELVDDMDGSPAAETVDFGLDGVRYTIDLSRDHAAQLRSVLRPYLRNARTQPASSGTPTRQRRRAEANSTALIRDLARRAKGQRRANDEPEPATEDTAARPEAPDAAGLLAAGGGQERAAEPTATPAGQPDQPDQPDQPAEPVEPAEPVIAETGEPAETAGPVEPAEPAPAAEAPAEQTGPCTPLAPVFQPPQA